MSKSQVNKGMNIILPDIYCKEAKINPNHETAIKICNEWFSQQMKIKWEDSNSLISAACYLHPECKDINKLVLIGKAFALIILIDDYLDKNPDQMEHWLKVIERKKAITADPVEIMYEIIINELMEKPFEYSQKLRIMDSFALFVESYKTTSKIRNGDLKPTMAEFTGLRYIDSLLHFAFIMVEFDLEINLSDKWHINAFNELHKTITEQMCIVNDIYSFKKELEGEDYPKYTYMSIVRQNSNLTFEEALQLAAKRVECLEIDISNLFAKVRSFADEIPNEYLSRLIAVNEGHHYWIKTAKRYNSF